MADPTLPVAVLEAWGLIPTRVRIRKVRGGFSGAEIYHCRHDDGSETALRRWPADTPATRIGEVQRVIQQARRQGCSLVPTIVDPATALLTVQGRHWEHSQWMPGRPCQVASQASPELTACVAKAASAVGQFHAAVRHLGTRHLGTGGHLGTGTECPAAVTERCQRIAAVERFLQEPSVATTGRSMPLWVIQADAVLRIVWSQHGSRLKTALATASTQPSDVQYVLRDCHHAHILFDDNTANVSGLIDFDALRVDTPATDLGRLLHSFAALSGPSGSILGEGGEEPPIQLWRAWVRDELWQAAVAGLRQHCPFSDQQWELARLLADATTLLSLANWVTWSVKEGPGGLTAYAGQLDLVQNRVEHLCQFAINYLTE